MRYKGQSFYNIEIRVDFIRFENCSFSNCTLIYGGYSPLVMSNCNFINVNWVFVDAAKNTIEFMRAIYHSGYGGQQLIDKTVQDIKTSTLPPVPTF